MSAQGHSSKGGELDPSFFFFCKAARWPRHAGEKGGVGKRGGMVKKVPYLAGEVDLDGLNANVLGTSGHDCETCLIKKFGVVGGKRESR